MPEPPPDRITFSMAVTETADTFSAFLTVTNPQQIQAALAQGKPVLINIPAVQWGLRSLATVQHWSGKLGWWIVKVIATWLIIQWLNAQLPNTGLPFPDWAKFHLELHGDKVIVSPHEE